MVSVIVPIYNVAPYIERCAKSLFQQTLQDLEILFIDDCSPDNSISIIQELLKSFPNRINATRIIRMATNSGQAAVRKRGIIEAQGDYIIHCDGDDWVDHELYERMYHEALRTGADMVICDELWEYEDISVLHADELVYDNGKQIMENWYKKTIGMFCHNKLIKRNLYVDNDIYPWEGLNMWEDNGLMSRLVYYSERIAQVHGVHYHYNKANVTSITAHYGNNQIEQMISIAKNLTDFFQSKPDARDFTKTTHAFQFLAKINLISTSWSGLQRYYRLFPQSERIVTELDRNAFSKKGKVRFYMVRCHLAWLFVILYKIMSSFEK